MKYLALLFLISCGLYVTPKFQPGDCIVHAASTNEFSDTPELDSIAYRKILKVGKKVYQYEFDQKGLIGERDIDITDKYYVKVDCPAGV